ncbi:hypothetical protein 3 [Changjiang tombus-like virus 4]|uniref:hypothetical protein 3 n=1 Tax=Changjiang tombus-like virus 4 TaxID=1922818 RepID=UPI00090C58E0|nr:hypothetical protein 3 [Changjiang tombus-like virus 4]APG76245.1 hypothetical protein 3 [Changjiang tombus-like virus 4]
MAKGNRSRSKRKGKAPNAGNTTRAKPALNLVRRSRLLSLTPAERKYAHLVADPCNGPLSAGIFGDGSGGVISRFETDGIMGDVAPTTASALVFVPAAAAGWTSGKPSDGDAPVWNGVTSSLIPGRDFLNANAGQFRCLAACLRIYWPGTELNRQGIVSNLQTTADIVNNSNASVGAIRASSTYVQRMPEDYTELKWLPSEYELEMRAPGVIAASQEFSRFSALVTTTSGVPSATPIRWRMVAVYEWVPRVSTGLSSMNTAASVPAGSFQRVTQALTSIGNWAYVSSHQAATAISSLLAGAHAAGTLASGVATLTLG